MYKLQALIESIEYKYYSNIEAVDIYGEVDDEGVIFYLGFTLRSGDYEEVPMMEIKGEQLSCEDDKIIHIYDEFANKYHKFITNNYDFICNVTGCYDI